MYIQLHRTFKQLLRDEKHGDDARALSSGTATVTLHDLLNVPRVVILSEAGSGKTEEIRHAARRMRAEGKAAFFLRLEHVSADFDTAFEEGTLEQFQAWLESSDQGWVLLDSIDESRLRSPLDFENALRKISLRLSSAKQRTHLLITGRAPAWRPKSDLELCERLFPFADMAIAAPDGGDTGTKTEQDEIVKFRAGSPIKIVVLDDLTADQIKRFVEVKGVVDTQAFLDAIERADAWSFTARPQDLDELAGFWLDNRAIGSRYDLMKNSVRRRLEEPDQTRAEMLPLPVARALEGALIIAGALVLTNRQTIQIPDGDKGTQGLKIDALLMGWTAKEISTLLQRPLFAPDIYGSVRFHHRSVKEYLAAEWSLKLLSQEVSRRRVEDLFFREQYGLEVVVPSLRPLLPWLAMADSRILAKVGRVAPEIVFEGGDPVQLPADVRSSMLEQICDQLATGSSTRSMADFAAIQRFAAPDLTSTLRRLVVKYRANDDIVYFLMRMVWQGRLADALPEAMDVARSPSAGYASRIAAFRAIADLGSGHDMSAIRKSFAEEGQALDRRCMAELVSHVQQPDEPTLRWLLDCVPRLVEYNEFEGTGLSRAISSFFERAPVALATLGLDPLHELLTSPPVIERRYCEISKRYQWLHMATGVAIRRVIDARTPFALMSRSLATLHLLQIGSLYNGRASDINKLGLATAVHEWPELKWALFWHVVALERKSREAKGERVVNAWVALATATYVSFDGNDFGAAVRAVSERAIHDDQMVALSLGFRLYVLTGRQRNHRDQLRKATAGDDALKAYLIELMKPPRKSEELKRMDRENARWTRRSVARSKAQEAARLAAPSKLEAQLEELQNPGFDNPADISQSQYYLFDRMRNLDENNRSAKWTNNNWRALESEFGIKTPRAFRDGIVRFWRRYVPPLPSEGAAQNVFPLADIFGLAGLTIEAAENLELFATTSPAEAAVAFRYAMRELNGFPPWFAALSSAHLDVVKTMMCEEIAFELQGDSENSLSQYLIYDLSRFGDWLWDTTAPEVLRLLQTYPTKGTDRLLHLLDIIQGSKMSDADIATFAAEGTASAGSETHRPLWLAVWTGVAAGPAIDALEAHFSSTVSDTLTRTDFTMRYITYLLGGDNESSRVRTGFYSPPVLKRLYILVHEHVRSSEDTVRANKGVYSPALRDHAQDARERLVGILKGIPGKEAFLALRAISDSHPEPKSRPWFALQAKAKAEADSERPAWSAEQVNEFDKVFERTPANHRELFDLAVLRLQDLQHELEDGDASTASVLIKAELETVVRNYISAWCSNNSQGRYVIAQEDELPDAKRPDLRWQSHSFKGPVPTELKIADNWSGPQIFERLEAQLAGDYLRDNASSRGIYLLIWRGVQKNWQLPNGELGNFGELVAALQDHWTTVAAAHSGVEEIKVIGIDLTKRAKAPVPKKPASRKKQGTKAVGKFTVEDAEGKKLAPQRAINKKNSAKPPNTRSSDA